MVVVYGGVCMVVVYGGVFAWCVVFATNIKDLLGLTLTFGTS